jgi:hypothetical protein
MDKDAGSRVVGHKALDCTSAVPGGTHRFYPSVPGTHSSARQRASEMYRAIFSASLAGRF